MTYTYETVGEKEYCICGECSGKVLTAKSGRVMFEEIKTEGTEPELFNHLVEQVKPTKVLTS